MNRNSAILLFLIPWCCESRYSSFIASFQSLGYWSEKEYLEYKENLPELNVFTVCHWEKTKFFSERINTIWAYCQHHSGNNVTLHCIEAYISSPDKKGQSKFVLDKQNLRSKGSIERKKWLISYRHRNWNHFCLLHPNNSKDIKLYHNGENVQISPFKEHNESRPFSMTKSTEAYDSAFIIGQEPDTIRGSFDKAQAFPGHISELNIWDRVLDEVEITGLANCDNTKRGTIIAWNVTRFSLNQVRDTSISDPELFCMKKRQYLVLLGLITLNAAKKKCANLGGKIAVPRTRIENDEVHGILNEQHNQCLANDATDKYTWLGLQKPGRSWYENQISGTTRLIDYFNWRENHNVMYTKKGFVCIYVH